MMILMIEIPPAQRAVAIITAVGLMLLVFEMIRVRKLREEYAWLWFLSASCVMALALWPGMLQLLAKVTGAVAPGPALIDAILLMIREHEIDTLVLGLPLNADGSEGPRAQLTRQFVVSLQKATELPLYYQDERLTTYAANQRLAGTGRTHKQKKAARDAIAAAEILQDFLSKRE